MLSPRDRFLEVSRTVVGRYVPIAGWAPAYDREWLRPDLIAGLTSWGVMVPVSLAYAGLAGVPPEVGLATAFASMTAYAIFGTSRHLKVTTSSTMAIMSAAVIAPLAGGDAAAYVGLSAALALVVGVMLVLAGLLRLGFISEFLAKPVVTGFIVGLAITIVIGQLPKLFGVTVSGDNVFQDLYDLAGQLQYTNPYTLALGVGAIVLILALRRVSRRIPGPLVALVLGIVLVPLLGLEAKGVAVVGPVTTGFPLPGLPKAGLRDIPFLVAGAAGIVFLAVGESLGAARAFATRHRYEIASDQELIALGAANLSSGLFGGFAADASLSQSATAEAAGTRSQLSSLVTAGLVLATLVVLAPLFATLPYSVLAAIVITSAIGLVDVAELQRYLRWSRTDFALAVTALVGVVTTTVLVGLSIAVLLSLTALLYRASRPYIAVLGRMRAQERTRFIDMGRHPDAERVPGLLLLRIDAPLYFFNANVAREQIVAMLDRSDPKPEAVIIDIGATSDLDVSSTDVLHELVVDLHEASIELILAQVKGKVRDRMLRTGLMDELGEANIHSTVASAVTELTRRRSER